MVEYLYSFHNANNIPLDVDQRIHIVDANDTPFLASLDTRSVNDKEFHVLMDDLPRPTARVATEAENTVGTGATGQRFRASMVVEKHSRNFSVTNSARASSMYGTTQDEYFYKAAKESLALLKDFEMNMLWGTYTAWSSDTAANATAGIIEWLLKGGGARNQGATAATISGNSLPDEFFPYWNDVHLTNNAAMTEDVFNTSLGAAWAIGTPMTNLICMCSKEFKRRLSNFGLYFRDGDNTSSSHDTMVNHTLQADMSSRRVFLDWYESEYGKLGFIISRDFISGISINAGYGGTSATTSDDFKAEGDQCAIFYDREFFKIAEYRGIERRDGAQTATADSQAGFVVAEMGLHVGNPKGGFGISRVDGAA